MCCAMLCCALFTLLVLTDAMHSSRAQALNGYQCGAETAMDAWLSEPSVMEALHVKAGTAGE
jgi:hypothetical protein